MRDLDGDVLTLAASRFPAGVCPLQTGEHPVFALRSVVASAEVQICTCTKQSERN